VNIIKVVAEDWIKYLLKYATKREPAGYLKGHELPMQCALHSLDPIDREVALRFIQVTPWSANEQTICATDTPVFETS
jgi:predicted alpha/beta hydrolase family esterase